MLILGRLFVCQMLTELELAGCNEVTEAGLWSSLSPRVVVLTLSDCINVADEAVGAVAQLLPSLYEFTLQAYHVTDAALAFFSQRQSESLSILRLHSCWELTNHGIVNIGMCVHAILIAGFFHPLHSTFPVAERDVYSPARAVREVTGVRHKAQGTRQHQG